MSPTQADNVVSWDRVVMIASVLVGLEIDFAPILITEIHERAFRITTTVPFPCLIFQLCRDAFVSVWHCVKLIDATKTMDIGLIRDDVYLAAPLREPPVTLPPLGDDLVGDV